MREYVRRLCVGLNITVGDGWSRPQRRAFSDEATSNAIVLARGIADAYQKLLDVAAP